MMDAENSAYANGELHVVSVSSPREVFTKQKIPYFLGISDKTTGAKGLSMSMVVIPPGAIGESHYHREFESAIYLLEGEVETKYGDNLENSIVNKAGDFILIPPELRHQPFNLSASREARAIVVRNDPHEVENVSHDITVLK